MAVFNNLKLLNSIYLPSSIVVFSDNYFSFNYNYLSFNYFSCAPPEKCRDSSYKLFLCFSFFGHVWKEIFNGCLQNRRRFFVQDDP